MDWPSDPLARLLNGRFTDGDPTQGILPSIDLAGHQNAVTLELINLITALEGTPNEAVTDQLATLVPAAIDAAIETTRSLSDDVEQRHAAAPQNVEYVNQLTLTPIYDGFLYMTAVMNIGRELDSTGIDHRISIQVDNGAESNLRGDTTFLSQTHVRKILVSADETVVLRQKVTNFSATPVFVGMYLAYLYAPATS